MRARIQVRVSIPFHSASLFLSLSLRFRTSQRLILLYLRESPPAEEGNAVLDRVDGVAYYGEDEEEADYYYGDDDVALDHFGGL
jgi:hypothetical protein